MPTLMISFFRIQLNSAACTGECIDAGQGLGENGTAAKWNLGCFTGIESCACMVTFPVTNGLVLILILIRRIVRSRLRWTILARKGIWRCRRWGYPRTGRRRKGRAGYDLGSQIRVTGILVFVFADTFETRRLAAADGDNAKEEHGNGLIHHESLSICQYLGAGQ